jgi:DNA-binding PadR family transcriptional regulator
VNHNRLYVLAVLASHGPMHGHGIRRQAREERTELWSNVQAGSLYPALHKLAAEELVRPLRTEQVGKRPARTVYEITDEGRRELRLLWEEAFTESIAPASVDLAITYAGLFPSERVQALLEERRAALKAEQAMLERLHATAEPYLTEWEKAASRHHRMRVDTEMNWLAELGNEFTDSR